MPAVFGLGVPREAALAMVRHGALVELGWELQDTAERLYERCFHPQGAALQPTALFKFMMMHHAMQWSLVIPMNLYYSELSGYHELVLMLQGAAGAAILVQFYGYTLDTTQRAELRQMIILSAVGFGIMVYTRLMHYWWSVWKCLSHFYAEGSFVVLAVAVACSVFLMPFVAVAFVPQMWNKLMKFTQLYLAEGSDDHNGIAVPVLLGRSSSPEFEERMGKPHVE